MSNRSQQFPTMTRQVTKVALLLCLAMLGATWCRAQASRKHETPVVSRTTVRDVLSWFPADTETIVVANGPFPMQVLTADDDQTQNRGVSTKELKGEFEDLPLSLVGINKSLTEKYLRGYEVTIAIEGSRRFRPPSGLGEMPFEGCDIVVFTHDIADRAQSFMKDSKDLATRHENVEGQSVAVFQETLEEDVWTTFVAFPRANIAVVATDRDFLRDVLARIGGAGGPRALPDDLPEWKYVKTSAPCWGLRHYDKTQSQFDPSSPFDGEKSATIISDDQAIGVVFNFDPVPDSTATIIYLSGSKDILQKVKQAFFPPGVEPESTKDMQIQFRQLAPGVVRSSFVLTHSEPASFFLFILMGLLGHAVYV